MSKKADLVIDELSTGSLIDTKGIKRQICSDISRLRIVLKPGKVKSITFSCDCLPTAAGLYDGSISK